MTTTIANYLRYAFPRRRALKLCLLFLLSIIVILFPISSPNRRKSSKLHSAEDISIDIDISIERFKELDKQVLELQLEETFIRDNTNNNINNDKNTNTINNSVKKQSSGIDIEELVSGDGEEGLVFTAQLLDVPFWIRPQSVVPVFEDDTSSNTVDTEVSNALESDVNDVGDTASSSCSFYSYVQHFDNNTDPWTNVKPMLISLTWDNITTYATSNPSSNIHLSYKQLLGPRLDYIIRRDRKRRYKLSDHNLITNELPIVEIPNAWVVENGRVMDCQGRGFELSVGCCRWLPPFWTMVGVDRFVPSLVLKEDALQKVNEQLGSSETDTKENTELTLSSFETLSTLGDKFIKSIIRTALPVPKFKILSDPVYVLSHSHSSTYYHFLIESVPKIFWMLPELLENPRIRIVVGEINSFTTRILSELGIDSHRLITAETFKPIFSPRAIIPPHFMTDQHFELVRGMREYFWAKYGVLDTNAFDCASLLNQSITFHSHFAKYHPKEPNANTGKEPTFSGKYIILLHRGPRAFPKAQSRGRTISNLHYLLHGLSKSFPNDHFLIYTGTEQPDPFRAAVEYFKCSKMVIGVHGAGLSNIIFSDPGTPMIDLTHRENIQNYVFETLTNKLGYPFSEVEVNVSKYRAWKVVKSEVGRIVDKMKETFEGVKKRIKYSRRVNGNDPQDWLRALVRDVVHDYRKEILQPESVFVGEGYEKLLDWKELAVVRGFARKEERGREDEADAQVTSDEPAKVEVGMDDESAGEIMNEEGEEEEEEVEEGEEGKNENDEGDVVDGMDRDAFLRFVQTQRP